MVKEGHLRAAQLRRPPRWIVPTVSGFKEALERIFFGILPLVMLGILTAAAIYHGYGKHFGFDFKPLWEASRHIASGATPYPPPHTWALRNEQQFVYPPIAALIAAPFAILPFPLAATVYALAMLGATALTLRILGVRDWRCYGIALLWLPVLEAVTLGTVSIVLTLGLALAWRYRDDRRVAPLAIAALVAAKVFLWPLLFWLLATRRGLAAARALALALAGVLGSWAIIGFAGLTSYPRLLDELAQLLQWKSYSAIAFGMTLGLSPGHARVAALACGAIALVAVILIGRAWRRDADRHAFIAAIGAAFLFSPIVWMHYLALLLVPVAITRPRLTPLWFVPLAMWATPGQSWGTPWRVALGFSVWVVVLAASARPAWPMPSFRRARPLEPAQAPV
jgi:alpha-1,2-mannosyltransferase